MDRNELTAVVTRAQAGDRDALSRLFNEYYNSVYYFALKTVRDQRIAEDITQESFIQVITSIRSLRDPALFGSWLRSVTYNRCSIYFNKNVKEPVYYGDGEIFEDIREDKAEFVPNAALDKAEFRNTVLNIVDSLPDEQRAAVLMYYFDELSVKQIAAIQGVSENTVKSRLGYARKYIKSAVEEYERRHDLKLHNIMICPLLYWLFSSSATMMSAPAMGSVGSGVAAATGVGLQIGTGTQVASAAGMGMQTAAANSVTKNAAQDAARMTAKKAAKGAASEITRASAQTTAKVTAAKAGTGVAAKAGMSLGAKIIAGVVAAAVTAGAGVGAVAIMKNDNKDKVPEEQESAVVTVHKDDESDELPLFDDIAYWQDFTDNGKYRDFINEEMYLDDDSKFEYAVFDLDKDGVTELLMQIKDVSSFFYTWVFGIENEEAKLIFNTYGYGKYRYSDKHNALLVSPEFRPFEGASSNPFYKLEDGEMVFMYDIGDNGEGYHIFYGDHNEKLEDTSEYFGDAEHFEWTEIEEAAPDVTEESEEYTYLDVIEEYEERFGELYVIEDESFYNRLAGVVYAELIDFDGDGSDELIICFDEYPDVDGGYSEDSGLRYHIYKMKDGIASLTAVQNITIFGNGGIAHAVPFCVRDGKYYIMEENLDDPDYYYKNVLSTLSDGRFVAEAEYGMAPIEDISDPPVYLICGEECSEEEYSEYASGWEFSYTVTFTADDYSVNKDMIERTKSKLKNN